MSEDMISAFDKWWPRFIPGMAMPGGSWRGDARTAFFAGYRAGVESQRARIAELEAERDRLLSLVKELSERVCERKWEWEEPCGECPSCRARATITPKEESRG